MRTIISFISGILFSMGLLISGMANPQKVLNFLIINKDFPHSWDCSLAFVMIGAIFITVVMYFAIKRGILKKPLIGNFQIPTTKIIDTQLIVGSVLFGIGWAIAGICPGPAVVLLALVPLKALCFFIPMLVGMYISKRISRS